MFAVVAEKEDFQVAAVGSRGWYRQAADGYREKDQIAKFLHNCSIDIGYAKDVLLRRSIYNHASSIL